jgi:hypothetical protein
MHWGIQMAKLWATVATIGFTSAMVLGMVLPDAVNALFIVMLIYFASIILGVRLFIGMPDAIVLERNTWEDFRDI